MKLNKYLLQWQNIKWGKDWPEWYVLRFVDLDYFGEFRCATGSNKYEIYLKYKGYKPITIVYSLNAAKKYIEKIAFKEGHKFLPDHLKILL
jgi:hypothetical protein